MSEIENYIEGYFGISPVESQELKPLFKDTEMTKGEVFCEEGKSCRQLAFIKEGYLRVYRYGKHKEVAQWISSPGQFITDLSSLIFNTPARWNIEALTPVKLHSISKSDYESFGVYVEGWAELEKLFIAKCFLTLEDRVYSFLSMTAEERYQYLYSTQKELFNQVPLQYLASMLGMTPETLSRLRKKSIS